MDKLEPDWIDGVPFCVETCPSHDGKRCELLGHRPDIVCTPAVQALSAELSELREKVHESRD